MNNIKNPTLVHVMRFQPPLLYYTLALLAIGLRRMFPSRLFLCCLLGSVSLVYGQPLSELICSAATYSCAVFRGGS